MATKKVTDLAADTTPKLTDVYHVVDTTDTSQDPAGSSYKISWATLKAAILAFFSAGVGITFTGGVIASDPTATQTFTNKTLTSPVINTPTITSPALTVGSDARGDLYVRGAGGFTRLPVGTNLQLLQSNGTDPAWASVSIPTLYNNYVADTGAANAYVVTLVPALGSYIAGQVVVFKAANANTTASTLNVNGLGAIAIKKYDGATALVANDIKAGQIVAAVYDGTNFQMISTNPNIPSATVYKSGTVTRDASTASGTQIIAHGLGVIPKFVMLNASLIGAVPTFAETAYNGTTQNSVSNYYSGAGSPVTDTSFSIGANSNPGGYSSGVVTFDSTNITITWTKAGTATGVYYILWTANS